MELGLAMQTACVRISAGEGEDGMAGDTRAKLHRLDVLGTRALGSTAFRVRYLLTLMEFVETNTFETRRMEEQILCASRADESEASVRQSLNTSLSHVYTSVLNSGTGVGRPT